MSTVECVNQCEACGLHWRDPAPCALASGELASPSLPHVKRVICTCRTCMALDAARTEEDR